jgi:hypothetical protein
MKNIIIKIILNSRVISVILFLSVGCILFLLNREANEQQHINMQKTICASTILKLIEQEYEIYRESLVSNMDNSYELWKNFCPNLVADITYSQNLYDTNLTNSKIFCLTIHVFDHIPVYVFTSYTNSNYIIVASYSYNGTPCTFYLNSNKPGSLYILDELINIPMDTEIETMLLYLQSKNWRLFAWLDEDMQFNHNATIGFLKFFYIL